MQLHVRKISQAWQDFIFHLENEDGINQKCSEQILLGQPCMCNFHFCPA